MVGSRPRQRENFHRTQVLPPTEMAFPNSPPTRHSMRIHPFCSWRQCGSISLSLSWSAFDAHFRFVGAVHHNRSARQRLYVQAQKRRRGGQVARGRPPFRAATRRAAFEEPQASSLTSTNSKGGCLAHFRSRCVHGRRRSGVLRLRVEVGAGAQRPQPARPGTIQAANFLHH